VRREEKPRGCQSSSHVTRTFLAIWINGGRDPSLTRVTHPPFHEVSLAYLTKFPNRSSLARNPCIKKPPHIFPSPSYKVDMASESGTRSRDRRPSRSPMSEDSRSPSPRRRLDSRSRSRSPSRSDSRSPTPRRNGRYRSRSRSYSRSPSRSHSRSRSWSRDRGDTRSTKVPFTITPLGSPSSS